MNSSVRALRNSVDLKDLDGLFDVFLSKLIKTNLVLENTYLSGSNIQSSVISGGSKIFASTIQSGSLTEGYDVIFYGNTSGEFLEWDSILGSMNVNGMLYVSQTSDFGNIRISSNTISSTNLDGDILLDPSGSGTVRITSTIIDVISILDPVITIGSSVLDSKDRGVEFLYSTKLGFFGYDDSDGYFTYIPDATNIGEVIYGDLGNAKFANGSFISLDINNGTISNSNSLESTGVLTIQPGATSDLILNVDSGSNISIPSGVNLLFNGSSSKIYNDGTDLNLDVVGGDVNISTNTTITGGLTVTGNVNFSIPSTTNLTVQRFTIPGGDSNSPNIESNITFVTVTGAGIATGTMPSPVTDGFLKNICMSSISFGCSYELTFPEGTLIDPVSGTSSAKKMVFDTSGQSAQLIWDNITSVYIITQGDVTIVSL